MASLLLHTSRMFLEHGRADIVVAVREPVRLFASVEGNATPAGMLAIEWERSQADLFESAERTPLPSRYLWVRASSRGFCGPHTRGPFKVSIHATAG